MHCSTKVSAKKKKPQTRRKSLHGTGIRNSKRTATGEKETEINQRKPGKIYEQALPRRETCLTRKFRSARSVSFAIREI